MPRPPAVQPLTVSELTRRLKELLEGNFASVWVSGEISNCTRAASGHIYLTLKDDGAQLSAVVWRMNAERLRFELHDGLEVLVRGRISVYEPRGSYQLLVQQIEPKGLGALELAFRQLCEKLKQEGLFDPRHKKPLPRFPQRIALVTSPAGAAVRDLVQVITRRWPAVELLVVPCKVQGDGAAADIVAAIEAVNRMRDVDIAVVARGGGSLEDLWAFNEEPVARAIYASRVPIVSAVGHEIDVTIADLVADCRALTPSEAGQRVVPDRAEMCAALDRLAMQMRAGLVHALRRARAALDALAARRVFRLPLERVHDLQRRLDDCSLRAARALQTRLDRCGREVARLAHALESLSPLAVLGRGYSLTLRRDGAVVRSPSDVAEGDLIETRIRSGRIASRVLSSTPSDSETI